MHFRQSTMLFACAVCLTASAQPLAANPFFSFLDDAPAPAPAIGAWQTTVTRAPTVVAALVKPNITTGSIARAQPHPLLPGPRITGASHLLAGNASYYWEEQMTATGERFNKRDLTAAHKTLPFGTRVRVTRVDNGDSVVVRINDRGPFKPGRVIDLSERAAENLGLTSAGIAPVRLEVLGQ